MISCKQLSSQHLDSAATARAVFIMLLWAINIHRLRVYLLLTITLTIRPGRAAAFKDSKHFESDNQNYVIGALPQKSGGAE
jgi:hypothetical protein